jgi:hypothetical protein
VGSNESEKSFESEAEMQGLRVVSVKGGRRRRRVPRWLIYDSRSSSIGSGPKFTALPY